MIDIGNLRTAIQNMTPQTQFYKILKEELTALGHWKNKPRGNARKGYEKGFGKDSMEGSGECPEWARDGKS